MRIFLLFTLLGLQGGLCAQRGPQRIPEDLLHFFLGTWKGAGWFSSGKAISATASFQPTLDSSWIAYEHQDAPPNRYKAFSMWGVDPKTGRFTADVFDNSGNHRHFAGEGWKGEKLVLTLDTAGGRLAFLQRFRFEKTAEKSFQMVFETSREGGAWRIADSLVFTRD